MLSSMATFGENLRRLRQARGKSQKDLAEALGYKDRNPLQVWRWERRGLLPAPATIQRLADFLECLPSELLENVETDYDRLRANTYGASKQTGKRKRR